MSSSPRPKGTFSLHSLPAHLWRAPAAEILPNPPVAGLHRLGFHSAPIALSLVNRPGISEGEMYVLFDRKRLRRGEGTTVGVVFLSRLHAVLWSCSTAVSTGLGGGWCLWSWRGRPALGRPPSSNSFLSSGRGGALDGGGGDDPLKAAVEGRRRR